jgi:hypothetical protein
LFWYKYDDGKAIFKIKKFNLKKKRKKKRTACRSSVRGDMSHLVTTFLDSGDSSMLPGIITLVYFSCTDNQHYDINKIVHN